MSEEILRALMQLFAIIIKQDGGVEENEVKYVWTFLKTQLGESGADKYFDLFHEAAGTDSNKQQEKLTSVIDSVRILGICRKINKTLNLSQKYVVLIRLFELLASDRKVTPQRLAIINTVAEVFKISKENFSSMEDFVLKSEEVQNKNENILQINSHQDISENRLGIKGTQEKKDVLILYIPDVNLYFIKYSGHGELQLNGLGLHKNKIFLLAKGSTIKLPQGKPLYYSDITAYFLHSLSEDKILFEAQNISYYFSNGVRGLKNISFSASHGNMIALMGSSGTGKTTLLNVLSGIEKPSSGEVKINGFNIYDKKSDLSGTIGYIPQDDLLIEELTVFENLYYNARFCFNHLSDEEIRVKVDQTLENLGLLNRKHLKVGNPFNKTISGGQRKRLNIALELIREPSVLFVDEPTSGLSSRDSEMVMDLLRELTLKGKLIFVVIHQPSSEIFKMFDQVVILDVGGMMVYHGNPVEAVMYFKLLDNQINSNMGECPTCGTVNPELIFNIMEARVVDEYGEYTKTRKIDPEQWEQFFNTGRNENKIPVPEEKPKKNLIIPNWFKQLKIYFQRDFKSKISNTQYVLLSLLEAPVLGFMLAYIIRYIADPASEKYIFRENENIPIYIFMALIVAVFLGLTQSAEEIFRDRKNLKREKFLNLSHSGYLVSKVLILFLISAIQSFLFVLIANSILEIKQMLFPYWFALFTTAAFANMLGLNISATFNSAITIYIVIPLLIIPMMILSGAMFSFEKLNRKISRIDKVPVLAEFMPTKWSYEALMVNQFKNNFFHVNFYDLDKNINNADFKQSYYLPELEKRLRKVKQEFQLTGKVDQTAEDLLLLQNELISESNLVNAVQIPDNSFFNPDSFGLAGAKEAEKMISDLKMYYLEVFTRENKIKNNKVENLLRNLKDTYYNYLDDFHNEAVSDHVRKIYERKKIVEYNHHLVRMIDPVYMDPVPTDGRYLSFRTHFFAPKKYFAGRYFETYNFNMAVIWLLSLVLYLSLYFNLLKKIINFNWRRNKTFY
ncbi:MAG: ATP-binding cassette domain-containing protein [Bacteroidales bacterium]|nr:ATP-binding cassette domain-containing protein [Bacteroidales bacterium]MCF8391484.1 ATP-binding cassette domain-containing protein [Bacteroidales bacterium]